jgi:hypothetical protein
MRRWFLALLKRLYLRLSPQKPEPPLSPRERAIAEAYLELDAKQRERREAGAELIAEMVEAVRMSGSGPWKISPEVVQQSNRLIASAQKSMAQESAMPLREAYPQMSQGAFGDIELALQNVDWMRQINLSWLEFTRWGIQQIILISRLYYIKNPILRRLIDISAAYVFGRGVEISSTNDTANEVLKQFVEDNRMVLGQIGLSKLEKAKYYDGNIFFAFFPDKLNTGKVKLRTIDATEMQEIISDPDDSDTEWYFKRSWSQKIWNGDTGIWDFVTQTKYYPALNYEPTVKPKTFNTYEIVWDVPIHHRKCGEVAKWVFGCPIIYPAIDWARAARRFLEACMTVRLSLATIAATLTTKGGQQAMEGAKQQLSTTVGPSAAIWDTNPTPVNAAIFASGPGTTLQAFNTRGGGGDPEDVRQYKLMCCMVVGVPETFLADVSTGNLATATTLDRPTELVFMEKQEAWVEDLTIIAKYVLQISSGAAGGKLKESLGGVKVRIVEAKRHQNERGQWVWEKSTPQPGTIEVKVSFPSIREGDIPALIQATVLSMTLGDKGGQVVGIDEKVGVRRLYELNGIENGDEVTEEQYPDDEYDPDRTKEPLPAPILPLLPSPGGVPQAPGGSAIPPGAPNSTVQPPAAPGQQPRPTTKEAFSKLKGALEAYETVNGK